MPKLILEDGTRQNAAGYNSIVENVSDQQVFPFLVEGLGYNYVITTAQKSVLEYHPNHAGGKHKISTDLVLRFGLKVSTDPILCTFGISADPQ